MPQAAKTDPAMRVKQIKREGMLRRFIEFSIV